MFNTSLKKSLAAILTVLMVLAMMPAFAFGADGNAAIVTMDAFLGEASNLYQGEAIANKVVNKTSIPGLYDIELYVAGKNGVPKSYGTDIVFVIDTSGSMSDNDIKNARTSVISAIDTLFADPEVGPLSRVAIVAFNDWATAGNFAQTNQSDSSVRNWTTKAEWATQNADGTFKNEMDKARVASTAKHNLVYNADFWATINRTNTQAGIHAGSYLLSQLAADTPSTSDMAKNTKVMVVMTDGGPNKYWNSTANTVSQTVGADTFQIMDPGTSPATFRSASSWTSGSSATGDDASANRAIAQAQYAMANGIRMYAIGYGSYFTADANGNLTGTSVATKTLRGIGSTFYTSGNAGGALSSIMDGITKIAAVRLNDIVVKDLIGSGFSLVNGSIVGPQMTRLDVPGFNLTSALWSDADVSNTIQILSNQVTWSLGAVEDDVLYRVQFQIEIDEDLENGSYYTNTNTPGDYEPTAITEERHYQRGTHNKLRYTFDGDKLEHIIYACEEYKVTNEKPASITVKKTIKGDNYTGSAPDFAFRLYYDQAGTEMVANKDGADKAVVTYPEVLNGAGTKSIVISDIRPYIEAGQSSVTFWLKELKGTEKANGGQWSYDNSAIEIHIDDKGAVTYPGLAQDAVPTFTNTFAKLYKVSVEYYVNGVKSGGTREVGQYPDGESYGTDSKGYIYEPFGDAYYFINGSTDAGDGGTASTIADMILLADDTIQGSDVLLKLYYINLGGVVVNLTKETAGKVGDETTMPAAFSFGFELRLGDAVVGKLTLTDANPSGNFLWENGVHFGTLRGKTLSIHEVSGLSAGGGVWEPGDWNGQNFVQIGKDGEVTYLLSNGSVAVENLYNQDPSPVSIELRKFFTAQDLSSFVNQGFDGAELVCGKDDHIHDEDCYAYTFHFQLYGSSARRPVAIGAPVSITLTKAEIEALVNSADAYTFENSKYITFEIGVSDLDKGPFSIRETAGAEYIGWTLAQSVRGIQVDRLGTRVSYPGPRWMHYAKMTNQFDENIVPELTISKEVLDARSGKLYAGSKDWDFSFDLYFGNDAAPFMTHTFNVDNGFASDVIYLYDYINGNFSLRLAEVDEGADGMSYSGNEYIITYENGEIVSITLDGEEAEILFTNTYLEPKTPAFRIAKSTNVKIAGTFNVQYLLLDEQGALIQDAGGLIPVEVENGFVLSDWITLEDFVNFSGTVVLSEIADAELEAQGWIFDGSEKRLTFVRGICASIPVASFTNNFFDRDILFTKVNNQGEKELLAGRTPVIFTLTLVNQGSENLINVSMTDTWFELLDAGYEFDAVLRNAPGKPNAITRLGSGDYRFDGETLSFDSLVLEVGAALIVNYTLIPMQAGELTNTARVTAKGSDTGLPVGSEDKSTITVIFYSPEIDVTKEVAEYTADALPEAQDDLDRFAYNPDSVKFNSFGRKGIFRITVANNSKVDLNLTDIKDIFGGSDLAEAVFYMQGEEGLMEVSLNALLEAKGVLEAGDRFTFYFITKALSANGEYVNTVTVTAIENNKELKSSDSAKIIVSYTPYIPGDPVDPDDPYIPGDPGTSGGSTFVDIPDVVSPLSSYPVPKEEEFVIVDEETPLGNLPKTGSAANVGMGLFGLLSAFSGMAAAGAALLKKKED